VLKEPISPVKLVKKTLSPLNELRVLVVEDNAINKFLIIKILKEWHVDVDVADNGQAALDKLKVKDYDIILMDTFMPVMNGLDAIKLIRQGYVPGKENIPVISVSAAVMESDIKAATDAGASDVIGKPIDIELLHQKLIEHTVIY